MIVDTSSASSPSVRNLVRNFETKLSPTAASTAGTRSGTSASGGERERLSNVNSRRSLLDRLHHIQRNSKTSHNEGQGRSSPYTSSSSSLSSSISSSSIVNKGKHTKATPVLTFNHSKGTLNSNSNSSSNLLDRVHPDPSRNSKRGRLSTRTTSTTSNSSNSSNSNIHVQSPSLPSSPSVDIKNLKHQLRSIRTKFEYNRNDGNDSDNNNDDSNDHGDGDGDGQNNDVTTRTTTTVSTTTCSSKYPTRTSTSMSTTSTSIKRKPPNNNDAITTSNPPSSDLRTLHVNFDDDDSDDDDSDDDDDDDDEEEEEEEVVNVSRTTRVSPKPSARGGEIPPPVSSSSTAPPPTVTVTDIMTRRKLLIVGLKKHLDIDDNDANDDADDADANGGGGGGDKEEDNRVNDRMVHVVKDKDDEARHIDGNRSKRSGGAGSGEDASSGTPIYTRTRTRTVPNRKHDIGNRAREWKKPHNLRIEIEHPSDAYDDDGGGDMIKAVSKPITLNQGRVDGGEKDGEKELQVHVEDMCTNDSDSDSHHHNINMIQRTPTRRPGSNNMDSCYDTMNDNKYKYQDNDDDDVVEDKTEQFFHSIIKHCQSISSKFTPQRKNKADVHNNRILNTWGRQERDDLEEGRYGYKHNHNHNHDGIISSQGVASTPTPTNNNTSKRLRNNRQSQKKVRVHKMRRMSKRWKDAWVKCRMYTSDTCVRISLASKQSMRQARISGRKAGRRVRHSSSRAIQTMKHSSSQAAMVIKETSHRTLDTMQRLPPMMKISAKCVVETTRQETALAFLSLIISMSCSIFPTVPRCNSGLCFMIFVNSARGEQSNSFYKITIMLMVLSTMIDIDWIISDYYPLTIVPNEEQFIYNTRQIFLVSRSIAWYMSIFGIIAKHITMISLLWNSLSGRSIIINTWRIWNAFLPPMTTVIPDEIERIIDSRVIAIIWLEMVCSLSIFLLALYAQMRLSWAPQFTTSFIFTSMIQIMYAKCISGFLYVLAVLRSTTVSSLCSALGCCNRKEEYENDDSPNSVPQGYRRKVLVDTSFIRFNGGMKVLNLIVGIFLWISLISALKLGGGETPKEVMVVTGILTVTLVITDILCVILGLVIIWYFGAPKAASTRNHRGERHMNMRRTPTSAESYNLDRNVGESQSLFEDRMAMATIQPRLFSELELDHTVECDPNEFSSQWSHLPHGVQIQYQVQKIPSMEECLDTFEYYRFHPMASGIIGGSSTMKIFLLATSSSGQMSGVRCLIELIIDPNVERIRLQVKVTVPSAAHWFISYLPLQEMFGTLSEYPSVSPFRGM